MPRLRPFNGAKLLLTCGDRMLTLLRDDRPDLPYPGHWDLPGGGREGCEPPETCARRELAEEFGLTLPPGALRGRSFASVAGPGMRSWLFAGRIGPDQVASIRFGPEGQGWCLMPVVRFLTHPRAVPHFRDWVRATL